MKPIEMLQAAGFVDTSIKRSDPHWDLIEVKSRDLFASAHLVLVLRARANWSSVDGAKPYIREVAAGRPLHVVVQRSCQALVGTRWKVSRDRLIRELGATDAHTNQELLAAGAHRTIRNIQPPESEAYFIEPDLVSDGEDATPALEYLRDWLGDDSSDARVAALIAPAGVGKTTLVRQFAHSLASKDGAYRIPLVVDSDQWASLPNASLTLWDIWKRAFEHHYEYALSEADFRAFIENGCLVPVFDGFDELCTRRSQDFDAAETLEALQDLADEADARIILTTRDAFWADIPKEARNAISEFHLKQFNKQQVDGYIERRFPKVEPHKPRETAKKIIQRLQNAAYANSKLPPYETRLWSVPLVVYLICESADSVAEDIDAEYGPLLSDSPLMSIFTMLCDRERLRRQLTVSTKDQLRVLKTIAQELSATFSGTDLDTVLAMEAPDAPLDQRELFRSHALLSRSGEQWMFRFDFFRDYLRAEALGELASDNGSTSAVGGSVASLLAPDASGQGSTTEHYVRTLTRSNAGWQAAVKVLWRRLAALKPDKRRTPAQATELRRAQSALVHLAIRMADEASLEKRERTIVLRDIFGEHLFRDAYIEGPLSGLDLTEVRFTNTEFLNGGFRNCHFLQTTTFERCRFNGTFDATGCDGLGVAVRTDCDYGSSARGFFLSLEGTQRTPVDRDHVLDVLTAVLDVFFVHGRFRTATEDNVRRSRGCRSPIGREALESLIKERMIRRHTISSVGVDAGLAVDKDAMNEVKSFLGNRVIGRGLSPVIEQLTKAWVTL